MRSLKTTIAFAPSQMASTPVAPVARPSADTTPRGHRRTGRVAAVVGRVTVVLVSGLVLGGVTSFAQTFLPDALRPFANSASGWTLLTAFTVWASRSRATLSAVLGALGFVTLVLGYQIVSDLRGFPTSEQLFLVVGVIVGPIVGVASSLLRSAGVQAVLGVSALAGIALGESAYGLILISEWTGWFYWTAIGVAGLLLLVRIGTRQLTETRQRLLAAGLTAAVAVAFFFSYSVIGETFF